MLTNVTDLQSLDTRSKRVESILSAIVFCLKLGHTSRLPIQVKYLEGENGHLCGSIRARSFINRVSLSLVVSAEIWEETGPWISLVCIA